jgi:ribosome recycling factor
MSKIIDKGDGPMNKVGLLKVLNNTSRGNLFSIEIPKTTKEDEKRIVDLVGELERDGKIKLRECVQRENSVYLQGLIKYASK